MRDPKATSEAIKNSVFEAIMSKHSKIETKNRTLTIAGLQADPLPEPDNYARHREILDNGKSEGINIYGHLKLTDNRTGHIIDEKKKVKLGFIPTTTNRHSYIINGKEYIVKNQLRLKPGVYTKIDRLGQPGADFNLSKGSNMTISYNPENQHMMVEAGKATVPLYTIMKDVFSVADNKLVKTFGSDIHTQEREALNNKNRDKYLAKLHDAVTYKSHIGLSAGEVKQNLVDYFDATKINGDNVQKTIGVKSDKVTAQMMAKAGKDVMEIYKGKKDPTWKDNIAFKEVHGVEDFINERLTKTKPVNEMHMKIKPKIDRATTVYDTNIGKALNTKINKFFKDSDLVNFPLQVNPMEFLENAHNITSMGEGGVENTNALPLEARNLHLSQLGFIDPVRTPDNLSAGVDLRMGVMTTKVGKSLVTPVQNRKGKIVKMKHDDLYNHVYIVKSELPGKNGLYRAFYKGKMVEVPLSKIEYFLIPESLFTVSTSTIPFIKNTQGQRNAMGAKMTTQALSLVDRELPIVDTKAGQLAAGYYTPKAPVDGVISAVNKDYIKVKDSKGVEHKINIPNNFALNYHSFMHVDAAVKVGEKVKKGQILGDSNFSKNGKLALGVNARVAFMPYRGLNFEDGFVITRQGADKFRSQHVFQEILEIPDSSVEIDVKKYLSYFPQRFTVDQLSRLDNGVIKKGLKVHAGEPLILGIKKRNQSPEILRLGQMASRITNPYRDMAVTWTKDYPGEVIDVIRNAKAIKVVVKATAPMVEGDKICSRFGSKGVVVKILENHEAPKFKDGSLPDVLINPAAVPSRMNLGQIFEAQTAKCLQKKGKRIEYDNMNSRDTFKEVTKLMKVTGTKDTDDLYDPVTKKQVKNVFTGTQYFLKLAKQTETNFSARAGGDYDIDMRPVKGGNEGAKAIGTLDYYALLSHNSRAILREKSALTSEFNPEFWSSVLSGNPTPPPRPTFAFNKTMEMLRGMGVNVKKEGNLLKAVPFTDKDIRAVSKGALDSAKMVTDKPDPVTGLSFRPEKGGLFDPAKTGGLTGSDYTHVKLNEPIVNTLYEKPVRALLSLKQKELDAIINHETKVKVGGKSYTGGSAIKAMLKAIDVDKELKTMQIRVKEKMPIGEKDEVIKKIKYLKTLRDLKLSPDKAYVNELLPIIPPKFRPVYPKETGEIVTSDANKLYQEIIELNKSLDSGLMKALGKDSKDYKEKIKELNLSVRKMQGLETSVNPDLREPSGFLEIIKGKGQPKYGYFQHKVMSKVQDIVGRGTIAPDPKLGIDECSIPEEMAWKIYSPFITGEMVKRGYEFDRAVEEIQKRTNTARNALVAEMNRRPVILNRAPSLHKFSMMAFKPKLNNTRTIFICPLVVKGFNADFDGDSTLNSMWSRFEPCYGKLDKNRYVCNNT